MEEVAKGMKVELGGWKWRFTFITSYNLTYFVWRVAEDKYAVTDGFSAEAAPYGLHTREALAYIIWMALEAPWGSQLPEEDDGALPALEAQLRQQATKEVLRGTSKDHNTLYNKDPSKPSQATNSQSWTSGSVWRQETTATPLSASKDQQASWPPVQDAPEYPLASLQLSSICLGAGQCGPVMQGWLWGVPVAVKGTDACKSPDTVELLWHEAQIYDFLKDLQGHHLPVLHGSGYWRGRNSFFLATAVVAGKPLRECTVAAAVQAVAQSAKEVCIIDFGHAYLNPTPEQCERELEELTEVLEASWMSGAQPLCTPPEAETIQLGSPTVLHGDEIKHFHSRLDGEESLQVKVADGEVPRAAVHAQYSMLRASDEEETKPLVVDRCAQLAPSAIYTTSRYYYDEALASVLGVTSLATVAGGRKYELRENDHMQLTSNKKIAKHIVVVPGKDNDFVGSHKTHVKAAKPVKELPNEWVVRFHRNGLKVINRMGAAGRLLHM
ncbi:protein kinase domain-containing protein [Haematococcus lacustris]|uniref:Protein kinase domain-containing protein n=1 Tax=Haematococcus lacustris TaxID=44745 RepID=A0A699YY44_HAELA|nr:protein kinase domain-containing protein [Haematococcus lacustris]